MDYTKENAGAVNRVKGQFPANINHEIKSNKSIKKVNFPGIDLDKGKDRMNGNWQVYEKFLLDFMNYKYTGEIIDEYISNNEIALAADKLHGIIGVAANLCMNNLSTLAEQFRCTMLLDIDYSEIKNGFNSELYKVIKGIEDYITL